MRIIGIDVGLLHTGYAIIEDKELVCSGTIAPSAKLPLPTRLKQLHDELVGVVREKKPSIAVYETIFYKQNPKSLISLAQARGVLLLVAEELGLQAKEYTPAEIKKTITGSGRASKYQIHGMVERLIGVKIKPSSDIGDAVACALCYSLKND